MLQKFQKENFTIAFVTMIGIWTLLNCLLLATVIHFIFVTLYLAFLEGVIPIADAVRPLIVGEAGVAMIVSGHIVQHFVVPHLNRLYFN